MQQERRISLICFTEKGIELGKRISEILDGLEISLFAKCSALEGELPEGFCPVKGSVIEWAGEQMAERNALLFIGACGIAVRAIAPWITDKLRDVPVLVMDEQGRYVIPILAGHVGGANELARIIGERCGVEPVITTATDIWGDFAVDLFAKENALTIVNREGIARISARILSGNEITLAVESGHMEDEEKLPRGVRVVSYPPGEPVDIVVTSERNVHDAVLLLRPREYVIGMGCKKGTETGRMETFVRESLEELGITAYQIYALASIKLKSKEPCFVEWSRKMGIPFVTYTAGELEQVEGSFHGSDFVREQTGVDNVCERAALRGCGPGGRLVFEKRAKDGMTLAVARREWSVRFNEKGN